MNQLKPVAADTSAYDEDYCAWSAAQARRLRSSRPAGLDWKNLAEEIDSLGRSDKRALGSALKVVLEHLIKWHFQPDKRSASWADSIEEHRDCILRILEDSPSLSTLPAEILSQEYGRARRKALRDSGLLEDAVPEASPFTAEQVLNPDYWPGAPGGGAVKEAG